MYFLLFSHIPPIFPSNPSLFLSPTHTVDSAMPLLSNELPIIMWVASCVTCFADMCLE
ncbi:hypothetical protein BGZ60DRAFT_412326 [Tricladium varicosporioides]|nr:hypothetical protein BGZ60DRAFT_412326 [Hymenoscyphus varicosporioides]